MTAPPNTSAKRRDHRIDFLRGLALAMIFINHMPGNWLENWTTRNFGFSDAAEVFVLLAGVAAALAYFKPFSAGAPKQALRKVAVRTGTLYLAHLASTISALLLFAVAAWVATNPDILDLIGVAPVFAAPLPAFIGIVTGGLQLGYFNILPMYVVLLAMTPILLWLASKDLRVMLAASATLYALTHVFSLDMPNFPEEGGWYFNPFAWQLLFAIGLALGVTRLRGNAVPYNRFVYAVALAYVLLGAAWSWNGWGGSIGFGILPDQIATFAKSNLPLSRMFHVLALAYVLVYSPVWRWMSAIGAGNVLVRMGRNALPVFCLGSFLSMVGYIVLVVTGGGRVLETALVASGIALMIALAYASELGLAGMRAALAAKVGGPLWTKAKVEDHLPRTADEPTTVKTGRNG